MSDDQQKVDEQRRLLVELVTDNRTRRAIQFFDQGLFSKILKAVSESPELEDFYAKERKRAEDRAPRCCPYCKGDNLIFDVVPFGWPAFSSDDPSNVADLFEHNCRDCSKSFWT